MLYIWQTTVYKNDLCSVYWIVGSRKNNVREQTCDIAGQV